jgi:hypothetical protein
MAAQAGANLIVSGSGIFKAEDMAYNISTMLRSLEKYGNGTADADLTPLRTDEEISKKQRTE